MTKQIEALPFLDSLIDGKITPGKIVRARRERPGFIIRRIAHHLLVQCTVLVLLLCVPNLLGHICFTDAELFGSIARHTALLGSAVHSQEVLVESA